MIPHNYILILREIKISTDTIFIFPEENKVYEKFCCPSMDVLEFQYSEEDGQSISEKSCSNHNSFEGRTHSENSYWSPAFMAP